jgi:predicted  nucleic acid-binding Zn-ribbon protein
MLEVERAGNAACQKQIADLEGKLKLTESLDVEVARLRVRLRDAEKNYETAASLAEKANKRAEARKEENERLRESLERHRYALKSKDEEIDITKAELGRRKNQVWLQFHYLYLML